MRRCISKDRQCIGQKIKCTKRQILIYSTLHRKTKNLTTTAGQFLLHQWHSSCYSCKKIMNDVSGELVVLTITFRYAEALFDLVGWRAWSKIFLSFRSSGSHTRFCWSSYCQIFFMLFIFSFFILIFHLHCFVYLDCEFMYCYH